MRSALEITPETEQERFVHGFDLREIDAPSPTNFWRLVYIWRLRQTAEIIRRRVPTGSSVLEVGCAQGNLSITLAEAGYRVTGVDLQPGFISYSKKKDDRGLVRWVQGDAFELGGQERFAAIVMTEIIEHVTAPAELVRRALGLLAPDGLLVLSTPNGHVVINTLPTFEEAKRSTGGFAGVTIGPAGEDHIFAFTTGEMSRIVAEAGGRIAARRYTGSVLMNTHVQWLLDLPVAGSLYFAAVRAVSAFPLINRLVGPTLLMEVRPAGR
ncbi:MAG TPA: methyltransferase domain-containing protein [Candidatus Polarisedimenticolia bacterium]|jgi:SAM-dependent methyltransferase